MPKLARVVHRLEASLCDFEAGKAAGGGPFDLSRQASHLAAALGAAVPLHFFELEALMKVLMEEQFSEELSTRSQRCSEYLGTHGDALMFRVPGKTAEAFNRLAEGIACMAFCPGGVKAFGTHWERKRKVVMDD